MDEKLETHEEGVIKRQWIAVIVGFLVFAISFFLSERMEGMNKYAVLGICLPMLYLGVSSIRNRLSIIRLRGKKGYSRDQRAVILGGFMTALAILYLVFAFFAV